MIKYWNEINVYIPNELLFYINIPTSLLWFAKMTGRLKGIKRWAIVINTYCV